MEQASLLGVPYFASDGQIPRWLILCARYTTRAYHLVSNHKELVRVAIDRVNVLRQGIVFSRYSNRINRNQHLKMLAESLTLQYQHGKHRYWHHWPLPYSCFGKRLVKIDRTYHHPDGRS